MTPQEEAMMIYTDMRLFYGVYTNADGEPQNHYRVLKSNAKDCAIIAVDKIIDVLKSLPIDLSVEIAHYEQVKQKIEKL